MYPEKVPVYSAGEGLRTLPIIMMTSFMNKFEIDVNALVNVTVLPLIVHPNVLTAISSTVSERQVTVAIEVYSLGKVTEVVDDRFTYIILYRPVKSYMLFNDKYYQLSYLI